MAAATDQLARLVATLEPSAVMYLVESGLSTYPGPDDVRHVLGDLAAAQKDVLTRAARILAEREVVVPRAGFPLAFTGWHDADLGSLLPRVVGGLRQQLGELVCIAAAADDASAATLAGEAATATRRHLDRLTDLATRLRAGLAARPA